MHFCINVAKAARDLISGRPPVALPEEVYSPESLIGKRSSPEETKADFTLLKNALAVPGARGRLSSSWASYAKKNAGCFTEEYAEMDAFARSIADGDVVGRAEDLPLPAQRHLLGISARILGKIPEEEGFALKALDDPVLRKLLAFLSEVWYPCTGEGVLLPPEDKHGQERWLADLPPIFLTLTLSICEKWDNFKDTFHPNEDPSEFGQPQEEEPNEGGLVRKKRETFPDASIS